MVRERAQVRRSISLTGQDVAVDELQTGEENLRMMATLSGLTRAAATRRATELLERFDLTDAGRRRVETYSGGMRRRLDLAVGLVGQPSVIFLDEPTTGLDPRSRMSTWEVITSLAGSGVTVFLTTQYLEEADQLADRIVVLDAGRVVADGSAVAAEAAVRANAPGTHRFRAGRVRGAGPLLSATGSSTVTGRGCCSACQPTAPPHTYATCSTRRTPAARPSPRSRCTAPRSTTSSWR